MILNKKLSLLLCLIFILCSVTIVSAGLFGQDVIEDNMTVEINGVQLTVPKTEGYEINESTSLSNVNDTEKFGIENVMNITSNNAWEYYDGDHGISLYVADGNSTAYSDVPDFSEVTTLDGELKRTHIEKRSIGDKVVLLYVTEGDALSKLIVDSATIV